MTAETLLRALSVALRGAGIPFMLTGSVASAYHGAGRATMDLDLVIDPDRASLEVFVADIMASGAYVSPEAAREALAQRTMFNIVDVESGWKADLIVRKNRPFSEQEFARRQSADFFGVAIEVASLEDIVLSKLEWAKLGGSARQLEDVGALLRLRGDELDSAYVAHWVHVLGLQAQWRAVDDDAAR